MTTSVQAPPSESAHSLFRAMADSSPVLLWMARTDSQCEFFNETWLSFTGRTLEQEIGLGWAEGIHPEDFQGCVSVYLDAFVARRGFRMEYRLRRHDGEYRWLLDTGVPRYHPNGEFAGYVGSCVDITEIKTSRESLARANGELEHRLSQLTSALDEKSVLLRELHHRVKNNLQLISSLLGLQEQQNLNDEAQSALRGARDRVRSIALLHDRLYRTDELAHIDMREYLSALATSLHGGLEDADARNIEIATAAERLDLAVDQAIPCGLIVNELVTNAVKHAFPDRRDGSITIRMLRAGNDTVELCVEDDGVGLPTGFQRRGAGVEIVETLVNQLRGTLRIGGIDGSRFHVTFPAARE